MSNGERIIVKLDPNYNPTGKPLPSVMLEEMKADPDFAKLSEPEKQMVIEKMKKLVRKPEDLVKYGTLKQKLEECAVMRSFSSRDKRPFILLPMEEAKCHNEVKYIAEGCTVSAGASVLRLMAMDIGINWLELDLGVIKQVDKFCIADIKAPITGKVFSLCEIKNTCVSVPWDTDLFIVSSIPDDTRSAAIKWYKETTGKEPRYKTPEDIQEEEAAQKANVDSFLSKWDL